MGGPPGPAADRFPMPSTTSLLPDQEFIPINTDSPSLDRMQAFGDTPFTSSLFSSPFGMFGPVTSMVARIQANLAVAACLQIFMLIVVQLILPLGADRIRAI